MVKMGGEHQRKMGGKLCKLSLIQAKKKISILSLLKCHKEKNTPAVNFKMAPLLFFFFGT